MKLTTKTLAILCFGSLAMLACQKEKIKTPTDLQTSNQTNHLKGLIPEDTKSKEIIGILHNSNGSNRRYLGFVDRNNGDILSGTFQFRTEMRFLYGEPYNYPNPAGLWNNYLNAVAYENDGKILFTTESTAGHQNSLHLLIDEERSQAGSLALSNINHIIRDANEDVAYTNKLGWILPHQSTVVDIEFYESEMSLTDINSTSVSIDEVVDGLVFSAPLYGIQEFGSISKIIRIDIPSLAEAKDNGYTPSIMFDLSTLYPNNSVTGPFKLDIVGNKMYVADAANQKIHEFNVNETSISYIQTHSSTFVNPTGHFSFFMDNGKGVFNYTYNGNTRWDKKDFINNGNLSSNNNAEKFRDVSEGTLMVSGTEVYHELGE